METKIPTLEEVKEYFKNAKEVREKGFERIFDINWKNLYLSEYNNWCLKHDNSNAILCYLWNKTKGYAEIVSYKEETPENIGHLETPKHYDNSKGSIYQFCENKKLNAWESDLIKRIVRCRKKGEFRQDLEKTKHLIDLYLKEYEEIKN